MEDLEYKLKAIYGPSNRKVQADTYLELLANIFSDNRGDDYIKIDTLENCAKDFFEDAYDEDNAKEDGIEDINDPVERFRKLFWVDEKANIVFCENIENSEPEYYEVPQELLVETDREKLDEILSEWIIKNVCKEKFKNWQLDLRGEGK